MAAALPYPPLGETVVSEATLEAARRSKISNLKLKTACLENEERIQDAHVSTWSESQRAALASAHSLGAELLAACESGTRWSLTSVYEFARLQKTCGLEMGVRDLLTPDDKPKFVDILQLKKTLQELKQHRNKARVVSFTGTIDNALSKLERVEADLRASNLDATDLAQVPVAVLKSLEDCMNVQNVQAALVGNEEQIQQQLLSVDKAKEIRDLALSDGEMQVAEEQFYIKAMLLERMCELVHDKFRIIGTTEEENRQFARIYDVQKRSSAETAAMKETRRRLKLRCDADLRALADAVARADVEDVEAMRRYADAKARSERALRENLDGQDECWSKIQALEAELQRLGVSRFNEVKRRIDDNDAEERRKVEYQQFLDVAGAHRKLLELTAYNCDLAVRVIGLVEELVAEGCAAIKQRYDKTTEELAHLRLNVHQEYLGVFRRHYRTLSILAYKKEKSLEEIDRQIRQAHIQLEMCIERLDPAAKRFSDTKKDLYRRRAVIEDEFAMLREKMQAALDAFAPTEEALVAAGVEFVHPTHEAEEGHLQRRTKIVDYRAHLAKTEEVRIAADRESVKLEKAIAVRQIAARSGTAGVAALTGGPAGGTGGGDMRLQSTRGYGEPAEP